MSQLFALRGRPEATVRTYLAIGGITFIVALWYILTMGGDPIVGRAILPSPGSVLMAYPEMIQENDLILNTFKSLGVNLAGYVEAVLIAIPIGFTIGLIPLFRGAFQRPVDALRYVPLTAVTGLFIAWFGIGVDMKTHFLAFGILIYLLPIIVQRIDEVEDVYLKTVYTLGASPWQTVTSVYIPAVLSKLWDDIRILTAISWTYIIVAETINNEGGLGSVIWFAGQRFRRYDKVFAVLILIMLIGVFQDRIFSHLDRKLFPHKYQIRDQHTKGRQRTPGIWDKTGSFILEALTYILLAGYAILAINEIFNFLGVRVLSYLFSETVWAVHVVFLVSVARIIMNKLKPTR
jgi:ABC-type nitrate/sulfonate/bicarbonate transport system permease component